MSHPSSSSNELFGYVAEFDSATGLYHAAEKIRERTGLTGDGADLVNPAFKVGDPLLALNTLRTDTEKSDQKGYANLLIGIFGTFRNVPAHAPRLKWAIDKREAFDALTILSYAHRRLDEAVLVRRAR